MNSVVSALLFLIVITLTVQGKSLPGRIVGGSPAPDGAYPYQVSVRTHGFHMCGGSIISQTTILTAAHCINEFMPSVIYVVVGTNYLKSGGDIYNASKLIIHEEYNQLSQRNDIALIILMQPIQYNQRVQPIALPNSDTEPGASLVLTGWGTTSFPGSYPDALQEIRLTAISNKKCNRRHILRTIFSTNICTFTERKQGACRGDSGGPLAQGESVVGIVSWGIPCGVGLPDVYTRVYSYLSWIQQHGNFDI